MARLSKILLQVWASNVNEAPNVFIGNVGHILTSAADVINAFSVPDFAVYNFRIDANNNVSFFVGRNFNWDRGEDNSGWLYQNPDISYFWDIKGNFIQMSVQTLGLSQPEKQLESFISVSPSIHFNGTSTRMFSNNPLLKDFYVPYANRFTQRDFTNCPVPLLYLPNVTELGQTFYRVAAKCRIYIGNYQGGGMESVNMFDQIISGSTIYFHPIHLTSGAGGTLAESLLYAQGQGAVLRPVHNKDLPNKITDLTVSSVTNLLIKTSPTTWDAEATAEEMFIGDTMVSMEALEVGTGRGIGLNAVESTGINTFDYFVQFQEGGGIAVREGANTITNLTTYAIGDIISIERSGTSISYKKNGATIHTSTIPAPTTDMYVRTIAYTNGATVFNAKIGTTPITWKNLVNFNSTRFVTLNFTAPAPSTNPIDFYEVWIESLDNLDIVRQYLPITQEITATGQIITGLLPTTTYKLRLCTVDTMYNGTGQDTDVSRRAFSNEIIFTTL